MQLQMACKRQMAVFCGVGSAAQPKTQQNLSEYVFCLWIVERNGFYMLLDVDHQYSPQIKLIKPWLSVF